MTETLHRSTFYDLLEKFCNLVEKEQNEAIKVRHPILHTTAIEDGRRGYVHVEYEDGQKFVRVVTRNSAQGSVHTFVEKDTGIIWGAAGYKQRNKNRWYGTLQTMNEWDWSGYYGRPKVGNAESLTLVPKDKRR